MLDSSSGFIAIHVYVNDLVLVGDDLAEINSMRYLLDDKFKIKDLGNLKFFLGMEVAQFVKGITLYQRNYTLDLLENCGVLGAKPISTPMDYMVKLNKESGTPFPNFSTYRRLVRKLVCLANTRPDMSYDMGKLSQFLDCPTNTHYQAAARVLRYFKYAPASGLFFSSSSDLRLKGFIDSNWGGLVRHQEIRQWFLLLHWF